MNIIEILKAIVLGIVEGVTEWLPISSTGHMILVDEFLKLNMSAEFKEMFLVVIQLGAIMAVVVLYWKKLLPISFSRKPMIRKEVISVWMKILVACIPAAVIGLCFDDQLEKLFFNYQTVSITLIVYGILFILIEEKNQNRIARINEISQITYKTALLIGVFQLLALIPGTSRSGATILGAILIGTTRTVAAEFTFYLAIPVMFGASLLKMLKFGLNFTGMEMAVLLTGTVVAFVVSILAIKFLMGYIKKHNFQVFGWYRIILGVAVLAYFWLYKV
ncbi:undecaprenyl-diphosphate phosphatase [Aminipila sp.]|uniref:undecaprenyl-diphosphate phosphatase n=1 Tax=Aminipila sp. TaxID=2060095 RepID=UPI0028A27F34|nr:undecaprenyl-diphosphate phosphatase [Aminipila sp.]